MVIVHDLVRCTIREDRPGPERFVQEHINWFATKKEARDRGNNFLGKELTKKEYADFRNRAGTKQGFVILSRLVYTAGAPKGTGYLLVFDEQDLIRLPRSK